MLAVIIDLMENTNPCRDLRAHLAWKQLAVSEINCFYLKNIQKFHCKYTYTKMTKLIYSSKIKLRSKHVTLLNSLASNNKNIISNTFLNQVLTKWKYRWETWEVKDQKTCHAFWSNRWWGFCFQQITDWKATWYLWRRLFVSYWSQIKAEICCYYY